MIFSTLYYRHLFCQRTSKRSTPIGVLRFGGATARTRPGSARPKRSGIRFAFAARSDEVKTIDYCFHRGKPQARSRPSRVYRGDRRRLCDGVLPESGLRSKTFSKRRACESSPEARFRDCGATDRQGTPVPTILPVPLALYLKL